MNTHSLFSRQLALYFLLIFSLPGCDQASKHDLPVYGQVEMDFALYNQDNQKVDLSVFNNKVYVTDFFFTSCPSICPIMKRQMLRVYDAFKDTPGTLLFSHTIDPEHDTVEVLKNFSAGLGIETKKWQMVTGEQDEIFALAKQYMLGAMKSEQAPGGYIHSGSFVLVDKKRNIRGYYDGTNKEEVDRLIRDFKMLVSNN